MESLNQITKENFNSSFNVTDILQNSVYYPASGIDATPIEVFANKYNSIVNVDYSLGYNEVKNALESNFIPVGYKLIGIKDILKECLTPNGFTPEYISLNEHEKNRLNEHKFIDDLYQNSASSGFAIWAVYELDNNLTGKTDEKAKHFSILHIRGEGCATFEALYFGNKINPKAIAIIKPAEGYGDNWTKFTDSKFRFYQLIRKNNDVNGAEMPNSILTDFSSEDGNFWGEYNVSEQFSECSLYDLEK